MAETINEDGSRTTKNNEKHCPSGFARDPKTGKCIQLPVGP